MNKFRGQCRDKHKRRDNSFGITWCMRCGSLFTKPSGKPLTEEDKRTWNVL